MHALLLDEKTRNLKLKIHEIKKGPWALIATALSAFICAIDASNLAFFVAHTYHVVRLFYEAANTAALGFLRKERNMNPLVSKTSRTGSLQEANADPISTLHLGHTYSNPIAIPRQLGASFAKTTRGRIKIRKTI